MNIDWIMILKAFCVGGGICIIGQILIDKTKLTPARILVTYVTLGAILGGLGIYKYLIDFAGLVQLFPLLVSEIFYQKVLYLKCLQMV